MGNKQIEEKKRIIFTLSNDLLRKLDDASREHGDCGRRMKQHDDRLNKLEDKAEKNKVNIGKIIACHNHLNNDCKLDED